MVSITSKMMDTTLASIFAVVYDGHAELLTEFLQLNDMVETGGARHGVTRTETEMGDASLVDYRRDGTPVLRVCHVGKLGHAWPATTRQCLPRCGRA
ncbi:MAG: hypothetical protein VB142_11355 [Burkholderia sp.]